MEQTVETARSEFIEKLGLIIQTEGLPRTAGRIMGLLVWEGEPVAFCDLATELQISRGSVSTATRLLEDKLMIKRVTKAGERQDYFQLAPKSYETMVSDLSRQFRRKSDDLRSTLDGVPECAADIRARVHGYADMLSSLSDKIGELAREMD
ncbi:transcriptional regulator [Oceanicola sp. D3]|uniref:GbsR/MarR family transcriptional regulator n=1 Tax=Oceanicola sp. D3 TaxID=2587163 RepID=UPI00111EE07F|nr:transcriptional regulator [Oceanicola sp. D3]QDC08357.1 transcriptional regulator [Oceanicola sp. D3]